MRYKITFSYDGTNFSGYQIQPNLRTVQEELNKAASYINQKKPTETTASGRTDAKVHAYGQVAHVDLDVSPSLEKLKRAFNSNLPEDIHVSKVEKVTEEFHARFSATSKDYLYVMNIGELIPTKRNIVYQYCRTLDIEKMKQAISYFIGTHDFRAFISSEDKREETTRTIYKAEITEKNDELYFMFSGTGFLKYQVRNMVGTLIEIGEGKKNVEDIPCIIESKNRKKAGKTAPACGLYLVKVDYPIKY